MLPYDQSFVFKKGRDHKKKYSNDRRANESVDDRSLSYALSQNLTGKSFQAVMG